MSSTPNPGECGRLSAPRKAATVVELIEALPEFQRRYNDQGLIERHGYRSPAQVRQDLTAPILAVA
jgi:hypothetical protein